MTTQQSGGSSPSEEQLNIMLDTFEENPSLASVKFPKFPGKFDNKWAEMTEKLNAIGHPVKSVEQWQNVWLDIKKQTSIQVLEKNKEKLMVSKFPSELVALTDLETRVMKIVGSAYMLGEPDVPENITIEQLKLAMNGGEEDFCVKEERDVNLESSIEFDSDSRYETLEHTPRRVEKRKVAHEESPTKPKLSRVSELHTKMQKLNAKSTLRIAKALASNDESMKKIAEATERIYVAADKIGVAAEKINASNQKLANAMVVLEKGTTAFTQAFTRFISCYLERRGAGHSEKQHH